MVIGLSGLGLPAVASPPAAEAGSEGEAWTADTFPSYIHRLTHFGQRADFSHDGKRILFIEKTYGDVYEIDLATKIIRPMTHHYKHNGYTRALYLSNGDILLSGSRTFDPEKHRDARAKTAELWVLSRKLDAPPIPLGERCSEGPAVSRQHLKIAWAVDHDNYPDRIPEGVSRIWVAEIDYSSGDPKLAKMRLVLDDRDLDFEADLETQNFVPPDERWLTFSAYGYQETETMGLDLETGKVVNYSQAPDRYDEPEGIYPDGRHTLVECDKHNDMGSGHVDLWKLALDGSGHYERVTYFSDEGRFKASNPVVSDDGRFIAFQVPKVGLAAGVGEGLYILDIEAAGRATAAGSRESAPLADGMYAVKRDAATAEAAGVPGEPARVIRYDRRSASGEPEEPRYLALQTSPFVPLILEVPPDIREQSDGRTYLSVALAQGYVKTLSDFTRAHLGGRVAIVVDGDVITVHKVRSPIDNGKMQITFCKGNACELIRSKLMEDGPAS
jgi:hypothetical protein